MENTFFAILFGGIALGCYLFGVLQFLQKGILLNNAYLYATKEEREQMNKKPYYRQSGVVFCFLGTIFLVSALDVLLQTDWLFLVEIVLGVSAVAYAIFSSVQIANKN